MQSETESDRFKLKVTFYYNHNVNVGKYYSQIHIKFINQDYWISRISQSILNQFS